MRIISFSVPPLWAMEVGEVVRDRNSCSILPIHPDQ